MKPIEPISKETYYTNRIYLHNRGIIMKQQTRCACCQCAGREADRSNTLELHHIIKFYAQHYDANRLTALCAEENMVVLCKACHHDLHHKSTRLLLHPRFLAWIDEMKTWICAKYNLSWTEDCGRNVWDGLQDWLRLPEDHEEILLDRLRIKEDK